MNIRDSQDTAGEGGSYLFKSSVPLPPFAQTLRHLGTNQALTAEG